MWVLYCIHVHVVYLRKKELEILPFTIPIQQGVQDCDFFLMIFDIME